MSFRAKSVRLIAGLGIAAAMACGIAVARAGSSPASAPARHAADAVSAVSLINAFALRAAARDGDAYPASIRTVSTTEDRAAQLLEPAAPRLAGAKADLTPVYLVTMVGHFTAYDAPVLGGTPLPTGTVMSFTVDRRTGQVRDVQLSTRTPRLSSAGPVMALQTPLKP